MVRRGDRLAGDRLGRRYDAAHQPPESRRGVRNDIPFTDDRIVAALDEFGWFAKNDKFVDGGAAAVASTDFRESPKGLFASPPKCYLHHQASFIPSFFPEGTELGVDADFFYMPPYAGKPELGKPVLGAGTLALITKDTPAARVHRLSKTPVLDELGCRSRAPDPAERAEQRGVRQRQ